MSLTVLDLESAADPDIGQRVTAAIARFAGTPVTVANIDDLSPLEDTERLFVTGSACMVDDVDWAVEVAEAVEAVARRGAPVLAVCFGHQLMARHFGGELGSFEQVRLGVPSIRFDASGPFEAGELVLVHSHRDHVLDAGDLTPIGDGGFGGIAATRHPDLPLWTCQGHPEWDAEVAFTVHATWPVDRDDLETPAAKDVLRRFVGLPANPE